jgi:hypothetical protein
MRLFWWLTITVHTLCSYKFIKKSPYRRYHYNSVILTKDDFPLDENEKIPSEISVNKDKKEFVFNNKKRSIFEGCDQRQPMNISDKDTLPYYYKEFYVMFQKHELLKKLQSDKITKHEKLKIMEECDHLLDTKPKYNPLYKGFEEFL